MQVALKQYGIMVTILMVIKLDVIRTKAMQFWTNNREFKFLAWFDQPPAVGCSGPAVEVLMVLAQMDTN